MKRTLRISMPFLCMIFVCILTFLTACGSSNQIPDDVDPDTVAAMFHGTVITKEQVELNRKVRQLYPESLDSDLSDKELVDTIVRGLIMVEEAERLGVEATQEEIDETLRLQREAYDTYPESKKVVDEYCAGMDMTVEEYFTLMETELYDTGSHQKLRDEYGREYCKKNGLEFTKVNPPQEMTDYIEKQVETLIAKHKDDVVYYLDTNT